MTVELYRLRFRHRPLEVTVLGRVFHWRRIYGLQVGPWFIGCIHGREAAGDAPEPRP